jgi:type IV secretion system protein VirB8
MATKVDKKSFDNYLAEARSWETDKVRQLEKSVKTAWYVTIAAGALAFISVVTVAILGPQKTAVPYVIRVDSVTGAVDVVSALKNGDTNYDEVMNKYNVQWYVRWREGYSKSLVNEFYKNVGIMSSPQEQHKYAVAMSSKNPESPLNLYGDSNQVVLTIKSTSFISENIALVRYTKEVKGAVGGGLTHWAATITFRYDGSPATEQYRAINPLGFQVMEYRNDPDQEISEKVLPSRSYRLSADAPPMANPVVPPIR